MAEGRHQVVIRVSTLDNRTVDLGVPFEIDRAAATSGRILAFVDRPVPGQRTIVTEGHLPVRGWALSSDGIAHVAALIDGNPQGVLTYGMLRPDIPAVYPEFPDVEHSGFIGVVPLPGLEPGAHRAIIRVTSHKGERVEITREFEVARRISKRARPLPSTRSIRNGCGNTSRQKRISPKPATRRRRLSIHRPSACSFWSTTHPRDWSRRRLTRSVPRRYDHWELWLSAGSRGDAEQSDIIERFARSDPRIKVAPPTNGGGLAAFANAVVPHAAGAYVAVVDPGDLLSPLALFEIARALVDAPETDLLYVDQDTVDGTTGRRWDPFFKPDWSPDLLLSMDYIGTVRHLPSCAGSRTWRIP